MITLRGLWKAFRNVIEGTLEFILILTLWAMAMGGIGLVLIYRPIYIIVPVVLFLGLCYYWILHPGRD